MTAECLPIVDIANQNLFQKGLRKMVDRYWVQEEKRSELFPMTTFLGKFWDRCGFLRFSYDAGTSQDTLKEGLAICEVIGKTCAVMYISAPFIAVVDGPVVTTRLLGCIAEVFRERRQQK